MEPIIYTLDSPEIRKPIVLGITEEVGTKLAELANVNTLSVAELGLVVGLLKQGYEDMVEEMLGEKGTVTILSAQPSEGEKE